MRVAVVMFVAVAVLAIALAAMALTDSAAPGWIAVVALAVWGIGRFILMGLLDFDHDDDDLDLDL
jgi:hypothetical protein